MMYTFLEEASCHEAVGFSKAAFDENGMTRCLRSGRFLKTEPEAGVLTQAEVAPWEELSKRTGVSEGQGPPQPKLYLRVGSSLRVRGQSFVSPCQSVTGRRAQDASVSQGQVCGESRHL